MNQSGPFLRVNAAIPSQVNLLERIINDLIKSGFIQVDVRIICHNGDQETLELGGFDSSRPVDVVYLECDCNE